MVDFAAYERRYGLPQGYLARTAQIESSGDPRAQNPNSSAGGLFQFIDDTARAYGLTDRFDPEQATDAAARLARDNANILRRSLGRDPTAAELYLAHQQGGGGASRLLSNANAPASSIVGDAAVRLNAGDRNMTGRQFADLWLNKFGGSSPVMGVAGQSGSGEPQRDGQPAQAMPFSDVSQAFAAQYPGLANPGQQQENALAQREPERREPQRNALDAEAFMSRRRFGEQMQPQQIAEFRPRSMMRRST